MKKIALIVAAIMITVLALGCFAEVKDDGEVTASSLIDTDNNKDAFTLSQATSRSAEAFDYAFSDGEPLEDDIFLTYIEAAKIAQELELSGSSSAAQAAIDQELALVAEDLGNALGSALTTIFDPLASVFGDLPTTNPVKTVPGKGKGGQTTNPSPRGSKPAPVVDKDSEALKALNTEYKIHDAIAQATIADYNSDPWSSRDIRLPDNSLVELVTTAHEIFDFIRSHPNVKGGDAVLSNIGDTMTDIYGIWGLGRFEAQTAFLMINIYYPNGSYVPHSEQQLLLL